MRNHLADKKPPSLILENQEDTYRLSELAKMLPDKPCYLTVKNWCCLGFEALGRTVYMEKISSPAGYRSSVEAYYRFLSALNGE